MEETNVKIKPKQPKIVTRVSNIENLQKSADDLNTTSRRIRRLFEKNTYQKRTQLSVLRRYKRRLDSIERAEEERKRKASKKKIPLPSIKKFAGSFFAPDASKDPLKAIGALAAFNSLSKISEGNILGAIGPGLVAAGMVAGPSLIGAGVSKIFEKKVPRGFDVATGHSIVTNTSRYTATASGKYRISGAIYMAAGGTNATQNIVFRLYINGTAQAAYTYSTPNKTASIAGHYDLPTWYISLSAGQYVELFVNPDWAAATGSATLRSWLGVEWVGAA